MRKILMGLVMLALILSVSTTFANHVQAPQLPNARAFELENQFSCGASLVDKLSYMDGGQEILWLKYYVSGNNNPFAISRVTDTSNEYWIDKDSDGHIDKYYSSFEALEEKYPMPCDAVL